MNFAMFNAELQIVVTVKNPRCGIAMPVIFIQTATRLFIIKSHKNLPDITHIFF